MALRTGAFAGGVSALTLPVRAGRERSRSPELANVGQRWHLLRNRRRRALAIAAWVTAAALPPTDAAAATCPSGYASCDTYCCPSEVRYCCPNNRCSASSRCSEDIDCPPEAVQCDGYCCPAGAACCANRSCGLSGRCTTSDAGASTGVGTGGKPGTSPDAESPCGSEQKGVQVPCAGLVFCVCADECKGEDDCKSGCCRNGVCLPACVCDGQSSFSECTPGEDPPGTRESESGGCAIGDRVAARVGVVAGLVLAALVWAVRRSQRRVRQSRSSRKEGLA